MMKQLMMIGLLLILSVAMTIAQDDVCSTTVSTAIASTTENCSDIASGEVCFGYPAIEAIVNCANAPEFSAAGDILPLDVLCSMQVGAMQSPDNWGIAMMRLPITDTEFNATYVLFGDVHIQNAGSSFSQLEATVLNTTEIHTGAGSHYPIIGSIEAGQTVVVNACNCTSNWVRLRLESGEVGWVATGNLEIIGDFDNLPVVDSETPVYEAMQAFSFSSGSQEPACAEAPEDGILIQIPAEADKMALEINAVEIVLTSTIFVQSEPNGLMTLEVLDGVALITVDTFVATVPAGARAIIPMTETSIPLDIPRIEIYTAEDVTSLPLELLPEAIDPTAALYQDIPVIVGLEACAVLADSGATICPLHFLNPDGDAIVSMDIEFVSAPQGEWESSNRQAPTLLSGDYVNGTLAWDSSCSLLGGIVFIGPVVWSITITDEAGHISEPFEAQFNCVAG